MRAPLAFASLLSLGLTGCVIVVADGADSAYVHGSTIRGTGTIATESRPVAEVNGLRIENRHRVEMEVDVRVGGAPALTVEADNNLVPLVHTEVRGNTVRVWTDDELKGSRPIRVHFTVPQLTELESTGSVRTEVQGLNGSSLHVSHTGSGRLELRGILNNLDLQHTGSGSLYADGLESRSAQVDMVGSGRVNIGSVRGEALRVTSSGSGSFYARGIVRTLDVQVQGSGNAELHDLRADIATITSNGSGGVQAWVQQKVDARGNGSGRIVVTGNPAERTVSGRHTIVQ